MDYYISKRDGSTKHVVQNFIYLGLATASNALEACTPKRLLCDVGSASAPTICSEDNVRLHELCKACTLYTQRSVALSWLDGSKSRSDWPPRERYRLCTVAHLRRLNGRCHFCTSLYHFVSRWVSHWGVTENVHKSWLYLRIWPHHKPWEYGWVQLSASLNPDDSQPNIPPYGLRWRGYDVPRSKYWMKKFDLCLLGGM
jgi:hypothetical protein